jgi:hypothetical protein
MEWPVILNSSDFELRKTVAPGAIENTAVLVRGVLDRDQIVRGAPAAATICVYILAEMFRHSPAR